MNEGWKRGGKGVVVVAGVFYLPPWARAVVKEESTAVVSGDSR